MAEMKRLGVTRVRVTAVWKEITPDGDSTTQPSFDAADPDAYGDRFDNLDRAILFADQEGLKTMIDIGFFAPLWASSDPAGSDRGIHDVNVSELADFARAVATRYDGAHRNADGVLLPRVDMFTLWNEPNHPGFVQPQWQGGVAASADWYRDAVRAVYPAIKQTQPDATVLIGATSPGGDDTGQGRGAVAPLAFLRRLACVDRRLRPVRSGSCAGFTQLPGDGWSHHPYGLKWRPSQPTGKAGWATMAELPRLADLLNRLAADGRIAAAVRNLWLTEYGYETNDRVFTKLWTQEQQAQFLPWAERLAWRVPTVRSFPQFLLADIETAAAQQLAATGSTRRAPGSWQSGLYTEDFQPKPAAASYRLALDVTAEHSRHGLRRVTLFGHVRPARGPAQVQLQISTDTGFTWSALATTSLHGGPSAPEFLTGPEAVFFRQTRLRNLHNVRFRLLWQTSDGSWEAGPAMTAHQP